MTLPLVTAIEATWTAIRDRHPDVPPVVVVLSERGARRRNVHCAATRWQVGDGQRTELILGGEGLRRPAAEVLATLLHEAAHGLAAARRIQDTSRQGRYHSQRFQTLATEVGITTEKDPEHEGIGWSVTTLPEDTATTYSAQVTQLAASLEDYRPPALTRSRSTNASSGNGLAAVCSCDPPRRIRVRSVEMFEAAPIVCGACREPFEPES